QGNPQSLRGSVACPKPSGIFILGPDSDSHRCLTGCNASPSASRSSAGFRALVQRHHELAGWGARKLRHPLKGDRRRKAQNRLEVGADFGFVCRSERTLGYESHPESSDIALPDLELLNPFSRGERPEQRPRRKPFSVSIDKQVDLTAENFSDGRQRSSA